MSSASFRKEPSMDEILASIRRIIESGDDKQAGTGAQPANGGVAEAGSPADAALPHFDVHYLASQRGRAAGRPGDEWQHGTDEVSVPGTHAADDTERFETFQAVDWDLRPAEDAFGHDRREPGSETHSEPTFADDPDAVAHQAENQNTMSAAEPAGKEAEAGFEFDDAALEHALSDQSWHQPFAGRAVVPADEAEAPDAGSARETDVSQSLPIDRSDERASESSAAVPESVIAGASALLSTQAGDQVAAAFDDLTHAIREGYMRNMEGMAQDLLRPLLQEWLEDNMPRIVERMVREEIERIGRGPRR